MNINWLKKHMHQKLKITLTNEDTPTSGTLMLLSPADKVAVVRVVPGEHFEAIDTDHITKVQVLKIPPSAVGD